MKLLHLKRWEYEITLPLPAEGLLTFVASDDVKVASISVKLNSTKIGDSSPVTLNLLLLVNM